METDVAVLKTEMKEVNKNIDRLETTMEDGFKAIHEKLDVMMEKSDRRYASKWVERGLLSLGSAIALAVLGAVLKLVLRQ